MNDDENRNYLPSSTSLSSPTSTNSSSSPDIKRQATQETILLPSTPTSVDLDQSRRNKSSTSSSTPSNNRTNLKRILYTIIAVSGLVVLGLVAWFTLNATVFDSKSSSAAAGSMENYGSENDNVFQADPTQPNAPQQPPPPDAPRTPGLSTQLQPSTPATPPVTNAWNNQTNPENPPLLPTGISTTLYPTLLPTWNPTKLPSSDPTSNPTTATPTLDPTFVPMTALPTGIPTRIPTLVPTTAIPTDVPSKVPTPRPTRRPTTQLPTRSPVTYAPTNGPTTTFAGTTTFYVIGDVPYNEQQAAELRVQLENLDPSVGEFVVHVGDIRSAADATQLCTRADFESVANLLARSPIPVLLIPGDNEWNDCPNPNQAWNIWLQTFEGFESRFWSWSDLSLPTITRMSGRRETFAFTYRGVLFVGLNLVGGRILDADEWQTRLSSQQQWLAGLMRQHGNNPVIVFGHANPIGNHDDFFNPLRNFVRDEWQGSLLYINGDRHEWDYDPMFYGLRNWRRIMVTGGTTEPPLIVRAQQSEFIWEAFDYDRQLSR